MNNTTKAQRINKRQDAIWEKAARLRAEKPYKTKSWLQWTPQDVADAITDGVYRHGPVPAAFGQYSD